MKNNLKITCPECGHQFSPEAALEGHVRAHLDKEYAEKLALKTKAIEEKVKAIAVSDFQTKMELLEKELSQKGLKLQELEKQSFAIAQKEKELQQREERAELDLKKKLLTREAEIRKEAEQTAQEKAAVEFQEKEAQLKRQQESIELRIKKAAMEQVQKVHEEGLLKQAELQKKLDDQIKLAEEMNRRGTQGSMQLQGEVQELAIEEFLKNTFIKDEVEEISKGVRGGDCVHIVKDNFGTECGRILYESKRTKAFSRDWIGKVKEDMRLKQASLGVIVTEAMPPELKRFGQLEGVWICSFAEFKSICFLLRYAMIRIGEVGSAQQNKGNKMQILYDYLTGNEFRQKIEAICETFGEMNNDLQKDRRQAFSSFSKREKQILKVMENTAALYGDVRGIAGGAVQTIEALEPSEVGPQLLEEAS
jgi:hypothetical protein